MQLGIKIKKMREAMRLTQQELGQRIGVDKSLVSFWEKGERTPSLDLLIKIASVFHTTTDYLLGLSSRNMIDVTGIPEEGVEILRMTVNMLKTNLQYSDRSTNEKEKL